ncbi:5580_t:CDS:2 [Gigaspora rosea]|nr:5580_t:CDS:2 [Gigaspora rosea]
MYKIHRGDPETIKAKLNSPFENFSSKSQTLDLHAPWSQSDIFCINVTTPPPKTVLYPYYNTYIRWKKVKGCNTNIPLTNFQITLYNDPKVSGSFERPRVKYDWSKKIASDITEDYYLWSVPLFYRDIIKDFTIFYIRIETETVVNSGMYTAFGMTGPLTILQHPDKENKTLFAKVNETDSKIVMTPTVIGEQVKSSGKRINLESIYSEMIINLTLSLSFTMIIFILFM